MAAGSFCGMLGDVKRSELSVLDDDPINLNASCDFSHLVCSHPPGYPKKQLIVGRRCAGPPEGNRFQLVQLAYG